MGSNFTRKDLIYTVYQEQSFSKAAQKLFISQPSLSVMIRKIEEDIGFPLFDRTSKPIRMTEAGMEYIRATEEMMHIEKAFENYANAYMDLKTGTLALGSNQLISFLVLPKYVAAFVEKYPKIELRLFDDNSTVLENMITAGQLDLVIDTQKLDGEVFEQRVLLTEELLLAVPSHFTCNHGLEAFQYTADDITNGAHLHHDAKCISMQQFAQMPIVSMTKHNDMRKRTEDILKEAGIKPKSVLEIDRLVTLYAYIEMGTAASLVSDTLVKHLSHHKGNVVYYKLNSKYAKRNIYVSFKKNKYYSKAMEAFVSLIFEMAQAERTGN